MQAAHERIRQSCSYWRRELICAFRVRRWLSEAKTRKVDHVVAQCADPVLRLPRPCSFDGAASVEHVMPSATDQMLDVPSGWLSGGMRGADGMRGAEHVAEVRAQRPEMRRRREAHIDLETRR